MLLTEYDEAEQMELFREEGRAEGDHRTAALFTKLLASGRITDALRASTDADYRNQLYAEFDIA